MATWRAASGGAVGAIVTRNFRAVFVGHTPISSDANMDDWSLRRLLGIPIETVRLSTVLGQITSIMISGLSHGQNSLQTGP
jgi:hypothetical protein